MNEIATVRSVKGEYATLTIAKKDECSKCGMCLFPKGANAMEIQAKNSACGNEGDTVMIEIKESGKLLGILLVFVIPLLLIGLSFMLHYLIINNELITLCVGIVAIVLWYVVLFFIDKKLKTTKKFGAEIISVIKTEKR